MIYKFGLLSWDAEYYLFDGKVSGDTLAQIDEFVEAIADMSEQDELECRVLWLAACSDDELESEEALEIMAENLPELLDDDTVVVNRSKEFKVHGVVRNGADATQHMEDCRAYLSGIRV